MVYVIVMGFEPTLFPEVIMGSVGQQALSPENLRAGEGHGMAHMLVSVIT